MKTRSAGRAQDGKLCIRPERERERERERHAAWPVTSRAGFHAATGAAGLISARSRTSSSTSSDCQARSTRPYIIREFPHRRQRTFPRTRIDILSGLIFISRIQAVRAFIRDAPARGASYYSHTLFRVHTFLAGAYMQNASVTRRSASAKKDLHRADDTSDCASAGARPPPSRRHFYRKPPWIETDRGDRERDIGPRRLNGCV